MFSLEENWDFHFNPQEFEKSNFFSFETYLMGILEKGLNIIENNFKVQNFNYDNCAVENYDENFKDILDKNKILRQEIAEKLEEFQHRQVQYETFKEDQKLLSQEIKERHEAFLMAKKYYKKFLKIYFTIESRNDDNETIFIQFFTEAKKDSENYSVRFLRNMVNGTYQLLGTNPEMKNSEELQRKLKKTNNIPGALCCIRHAFTIMKGSKKNVM